MQLYPPGPWLELNDLLNHPVVFFIVYVSWYTAHEIEIQIDRLSYRQGGMEHILWYEVDFGCRLGCEIDFWKFQVGRTQIHYCGQLIVGTLRFEQGLAEKSESVHGPIDQIPAG